MSESEKTTHARFGEALVDRTTLGMAASLIAAHAYLMWAHGQPLVCACGSLAPWAGDIWSRHNSQHLFDPYSFTHVLHGVIFYAALSWLAPNVPLRWRLLIVLGLETGWEQLENSPLIINRYRAATMALGYTGDSVLNSVGDLLCCTTGFVLASRLPTTASVALFGLVEAGMLVVYRDCLILNVVMLVWPVDAIRVWQMTGH